MPKKENLFRFLSVRGPQTPSVVINIPADTDAKKSVDHDIRILLDQGFPLDKARLQTGSKIIHGDDYFRKLEEGKNIVQRAEQVYKLLKKHQNEPRRSSFNRDLRKLLEDDPPDSDNFLDPEAFGKIWRSLCMSFFSLILSPLESPQDRLVIDRWIRGFYLAQSDDDDTFERRVKTILKVRPSVPFSWFVVPSTNDTTSGKKPADASNVTRGQSEMKRRIKLYVTTRISLQRLFREKIKEYHKMEVKQSELKTTSKGIGSAKGGAGLKEQDPSRITESDISKYRDSFSVLNSIGLDPELYTIPDLINALDINIAKISADLTDATRRVDVMLTGKGFVQVERLIKEPEEIMDNGADLS